MSMITHEEATSGARRAARPRIHRMVSPLLVLALGSISLSCGDDVTGPGPVTRVVVNPSAATDVLIGTQLAVNAAALDAGNNLIGGAAVTWESSDPSIASVTAGSNDALGRATASVSALLPGVVTIRAIVDGDTGTVTVTSYKNVSYGFETAFTAGFVTLSGAGNLWATPIDVPETSTIDELGVLVLSNGTGNARIGLYASDGSGNPSNLLTSANFTLSNADIVVPVPPVQVAPGTYWVAYAWESSTAVQLKADQNGVFSQPYRLVTTYNFADPLPATFPAATGGTFYRWNYFARGTVP